MDASKERAAAAEATSLAERSARAMAEAEARAATLLQQEQLVAIRSRCSWLEGKLAEADAATLAEKFEGQAGKADKKKSRRSSPRGSSSKRQQSSTWPFSKL